MSISLVISFIGGILLTGGFHEDGLADVCDGFPSDPDKGYIVDETEDETDGLSGFEVSMGVLAVQISGLMVWRKKKR